MISSEFANEAVPPRVMIRGLGGTMLSRPDLDQKSQKIILKPRHDSVDVLWSQIPAEERNEFASIEKVIDSELIDSATAIANQHIEAIVADIRERLRTDAADVFILLYGTDTMADLIAALGIAISPEELGDKTIIATCSMQHIEEENTDAIRNFLRAISLAHVDRQELQNIRGKIGLCVNNRFFPPRGIEKIELSVERPFISRYRRIAKYTEKLKWDVRETLKFDKLLGEQGRAFHLAQGIEQISLTSTSEYKNLMKLTRDNKATILVAPGNGNLRTDPKSKRALERAANEARGPIIVVGNSIQNGEQPLPRSEWENALYEGDPSLLSKIIPGGAMTATEARIYVSHLIAKAEIQKMNRNDIAEYIKFELEAYPFRDASANRWRKNGK